MITGNNNDRILGDIWRCFVRAGRAIKKGEAGAIKKKAVFQYETVVFQEYLW
jgi:hypothetical protein